MTRKRATRAVHARVFAALGDETRLAVLTSLSEGEPQSIAQLTEGTHMSRQALRKHLRVLHDVGVVRSVHVGREHLFQLAPRPIESARNYLDEVARKWDDALARLKTFVEEK